MSQALFLRIQALEARVTDLERAATEPAKPALVETFESHGGPMEVVKRGRWWYVLQNGVQINDRGLTEDDARAMADDLSKAA